MKLVDHLDKENLHHAYLIEGARDEIVPEILNFVEALGVSTLGNPDFCHVTLDVLKIDDARNLKALGGEKGFTKNKKIFLVSANNFLLEAQNALLKIFEEPIENTHFFIVMPSIDSLLPTLVSRFYLIKTNNNENIVSKDAQKFLSISLKDRLDFIKELLTEEEEDEENTFHDGVRAQALKFLDSLEFVLNEKLDKQDNKRVKYFEHLFKVREFLRQPGSSAKMLMESVALIVPIIK